MAKENGISLDDLINNQFTELQDLSKEDDSITDWFTTSNYALNYICSKNLKYGIPCGAITAFFGQSGTGKSMIPAIISKDPKIDRVIVIDSEGSGTGASLFKFVGCDLSKVRYINIQTLDSYKISKENGKMEEVADKEVPTGKLETPSYIYHIGLNLFLKRLLYAIEYNHVNEKTLIIVDSLSNMKSVRGLTGVADMGKQNQLLNALFSSLDNVLKKTNTTMIFANKVYTDINNPYNTEGVISGGLAVMYNPSLMVGLTALQDNPEIADADLKAEKERRKTGLGNSLKTIRARVKKSRFGTENRNAYVVLDATYGLTKYSGLFQLLVDFGVAVKVGTRYTLPNIIVNDKGENVSFYKKDFVNELMKNEEEYINKIQLALNEKEEALKSKAINLTVNDIDEAREEIGDADEEISTIDLANAMEAEMENSL